MDTEEQEKICKALAITCMWGHGGIKSVILDRLQANLPQTESWHAVSTRVSDPAIREHIGVITKDDELQYYLRSGYYLCNYTPDGMNLHAPRGGGLHKYVSAELAAKYGPIHDAWNFRVYQQRAATV